MWAKETRGGVRGLGFYVGCLGNDAKLQEVSTARRKLRRIFGEDGAPS